MRLLRLRLAMTACFVILLTLVLFTPTLLSQDFKRALPGRTFSFPQDHFSHPEFKTEWWYYSGHLQSQTQDKRSFGYQLTFFRTGLTGRQRTKSRSGPFETSISPILRSRMNPEGSLNILKRSVAEAWKKQGLPLTRQVKRPSGSGSRIGPLKGKLLRCKTTPSKPEIKSLGWS
jgi:hypothetical protein